MAAIADLAPCNYFPVECEALVAVGWLDKDAKFEVGSVSPEFYQKLKKLCAKPWQPMAAGGFHVCDLCQFDGPTFSANVFIPYRGKIYVAPVAIVHYIGTHMYRPPEIFVDAVLACPLVDTMDYKKAVLANGGRPLVKPSAA